MPRKVSAPERTYSLVKPAPPAMTYFANQPHACRGGETNPAGGCFACGSKAPDSCSRRPRAKRRK